MTFAGVVYSTQAPSYGLIAPRGTPSPLVGVGGVQYGTAVPHLPTPTPIPSPQGGGEEYAASANRISTPLPGFASLNPDYGEETRPC